MPTNAVIRRERFGSLVGFPSGRALEIGPLAEPILTRDGHEVRYVDVLDREGLQRHYSHDPNVDCDAIPVIDFTLTTPDGVVTLAEAVREAAPYTSVVACHVIEHVPDVIGWLGDIAEVLENDGLLMLVIPDRRYCFDYYRQQTSVGQMLQAAEAHDKAPSIRAVYDSFREASTIDTADVWRGGRPGSLESVRIHDLSGTMAQVNRARAGEYVDAHVWTFTPEVFVDQIVELGLLGMCDFEVEDMMPTPENFLEFYVVLRRIPRTVDGASKRARIVRSVERARAAARSGPVPVLSPSVTFSEVQARLREAEAEATQLREELVEVKSSERWKVGGLLIGPPRWVLQLTRSHVRHRP